MSFFFPKGQEGAAGLHGISGDTGSQVHTDTAQLYKSLDKVSFNPLLPSPSFLSVFNFSTKADMLPLTTWGVNKVVFFIFILWGGRGRGAVG